MAQGETSQSTRRLLQLRGGQPGIQACQGAKRHLHVCLAKFNKNACPSESSRRRRASELKP